MEGFFVLYLWGDRSIENGNTNFTNAHELFFEK